MSRSLGDIGEDKATAYLQNLGYRVISRNYLTKLGELDVVAIKEDILAIVEVKARKNYDYGRPSDFVNDKKQLRIKRTSEIFIKDKKLFDLQVRFDVCEVNLSNGQINYIENAFWAPILISNL